jgi:hypothetical protein
MYLSEFFQELLLGSFTYLTGILQTKMLKSKEKVMVKKFDV